MNNKVTTLLTSILNPQRSNLNLLEARANPDVIYWQNDLVAARDAMCSDKAEIGWGFGYRVSSQSNH